MPFQKFTGRHKYHTHDPLVTIQQRGTISLNAAAVDLLGHPPAIELYFDAETKRIGIGATPATTPASYPLRKQIASDSYLFSGAAFCRFHEIDFTQTRRYIAEMDGDLLTVALDGNQATVRKPRGQRNGRPPSE